MRYKPWVDLQPALQRILEPQIFTIDDVMRQFASEPGAPKGDYRITEKNKPNPARAYVVKRLAQEGQVTVRTAQRMITEAKQQRPPTAPRMKLLQAGAQRSFRQYHTFVMLRDLSDHGTLVYLRANILIEYIDGTVDDRHRLIKGVYIPSVHMDPVIGGIWEEFIAAWRAEHFEEATEAWQKTYFASFEPPLGSGVGSIYDVELLTMWTIATEQEHEEQAA